MSKVVDYTVPLGARAYDIHIESGCLGRLGAAMRRLMPDASRSLIVSNTTVAPLYLDAVQGSL
ncbi:MAG: 3-dehydroquinate synthase, partial [Mariprofundaceae bacterium]